MDVARWIAGHIAANPVVMDTVADTIPIRHHWGKATEAHGWTSERAGREDVVVDGSISWVCVQAVQSLAL